MSTDPINSEPRRVIPPYDVPETAFDHLRAVDTDAWRMAVRRHRLGALLDPLEGLAITDYEHKYLEWLAGFDVPTVAVVAALLRRARAARPVGQLTDEDVAPLGAETDRCLGPGCEENLR